MLLCGIFRISPPGDKTKRDFSLLFFIKQIQKMKRIIKQVAAIDVAKDELVICLGRMYDDWTPELYAGKTFANNTKGMGLLLAWVKQHTSDQTTVRFVMEATGVYHEALTYFLDDEGREVSVVLPNKISNYIRTLEVK